MKEGFFFAVDSLWACFFCVHTRVSKYTCGVFQASKVFDVERTKWKISIVKPRPCQVSAEYNRVLVSWKAWHFDLTFYTSFSQFRLPLTNVTQSWASAGPNHDSCRWIIMLVKCGHPDLNIFHLKWTIGTHGNWKKSKSWGPLWSYQLNSTANLAHLAHSLMGWIGSAVYLIASKRPPGFQFFQFPWVQTLYMYKLKFIAT